MQRFNAEPDRHHARRLHPLPVRIMHWINAIAMLIMISSGWKIYNDDVIFGWLHFPESLTLGHWAQHGLQWHFFGMWIVALNGLAYVTYGLATRRFRRMLLPIRLQDLLAAINDALRLRLAHDDPTQYNAVQRVLYIGVILVAVLIVLSGLALWKPAMICVMRSLTVPGELGRKMVVAFPVTPISRIVSKYWVMRTMAITSCAVEPSTAVLNSSTDACKPLMMA